MVVMFINPRPRLNSVAETMDTQRLRQMVQDSYDVLTQCLKSERELEVLMAVTANMAAQTREHITSMRRNLTSHVRALRQRSDDGREGPGPLTSSATTLSISAASINAIPRVSIPAAIIEAGA